MWRRRRRRRGGGRGGEEEGGWGGEEEEWGGGGEEEGKGGGVGEEGKGGGGEEDNDSNSINSAHWLFFISLLIPDNLSSHAVIIKVHVFIPSSILCVTGWFIAILL